MSFIDLQNNPETWDLNVLNGDLVLIYDQDTVTQFLIQTLQFFRGEWFLDLSKGIPYYEDILVANPSPAVIDGILKDAITDAPGVIELVDFSLDLDNETGGLSLTFTVRAESGPITITDFQLGGTN